MSRTIRIPKGKSINPTFFVFCEGETEEKYICYVVSVRKFITIKQSIIYAKMNG